MTLSGLLDAVSWRESDIIAETYGIASALSQLTCLCSYKLQFFLVSITVVVDLKFGIIMAVNMYIVLVFVKDWGSTEIIL
jgi:hypothetical protein